MPKEIQLNHQVGLSVGAFSARSDEYFMAHALQMALNAAQLDEVPVGAVVVHQGQIVAASHNQPISACDPTAHAEIRALRQAAEVLGNYRLVGCELFVTLEPCLMCFGAMVHARVKRIVYGAREPRAGVLESQLQAASLSFLNHQVSFRSGVLAEASSAMLKEFFARKRSR